MSDQGWTPALTGLSRVFLIPNRVRVDRIPQYESCLMMDALSQALGDVERIECPDPQSWGKFIEVGKIKGSEERAETSLMGRYALDIRSELLKLAKIGCSSDVHLHLGECTTPSDFDVFKKSVILEDVLISNYGTEALGALASDANAKIDETAEISIGSFYEVVPLNYVERGADVVTTEIIDMVRCDMIGCGECEDESDGCERFYGITQEAGGSPSTPADVVFSLDKGTNWSAHDIETLPTGDPSGIACVGGYVVVVASAAGNHHYALKSEFDNGLDPAFTAQATGYVGGPNDIWSVGHYAFIVGESGYIYGMRDPTAAVVVLDAGVANSDSYYAVHAISDQVAVAVGESGQIAFTLDGVNWVTSLASPVGVGIDLHCVWVHERDYWMVGANNGNTYYTLDAGDTWTQMAFPGDGVGSVSDLQFPTPSVGFLAHSTAAPRGRLLRTTNGGNSWYAAPMGSAQLPIHDYIEALATCPYDPNIVVGGGKHDTGTDGIIIVGRD